MYQYSCFFVTKHKTLSDTNDLKACWNYNVEKISKHHPKSYKINCCIGVKGIPTSTAAI